jgi:hypothetical protein
MYGMYGRYGMSVCIVELDERVKVDLCNRWVAIAVSIVGDGPGF